MPRLFDGLEAVPITDASAIARGDRAAKPTRRSKGKSNTSDDNDASKPRKGDGGPKAGKGKGKASSKGKGKGKGKAGRVTPKKKAKFEKVKGKKFRCSDLEWLKMVVCFRPMWELALQFDAIIAGPVPVRRRGVKRKCRTFEAMLLDVAAWRYGTYERAADNLGDPEVWGMLCEAVEQAYPHNTKMRLCKTPPSRSQNYRFRTRYVTDDLLKAMHKRIELAAYQAMSAMGMLEPPQESLTNPDPYSFLTGDGCWLPALSSLTRDDAVDPETGEIIGRYDLDAVTHGTHEGKAASPGHLLVMVQARTRHPKERIVVTTRLKSDHNPEVNRNDATIAVTAVLELCKRFPQLRQAFIGIVYDMALSTKDFDRLLDEGLIPVSKVPLTSQGEVAAENLGMHDFKTKDGKTHRHIVTAVHTMPCITLTDSHGIDYYQPLKLVQVKKTKRKKRPQVSTRRAIPNGELVPEYLVGAETRIRHTRTNKERDAGESRSKALRIFAEADEQFDIIAPRRNDSESNNADKKSRMWNRRCRTLRHQSVEFNAIAYQIHVLITALHSFHNRTGANMTQWFGQHQVATKVTRQAHLALAA